MKKSSSAFFIATPVIIITVLLFSAINYLFYETITPNKYGIVSIGEEVEFQRIGSISTVNFRNEAKLPASSGSSNKQFSNINNYSISNDYNYQIDMTHENKTVAYQEGRFNDEASGTITNKRNRNFANNTNSVNSQNLGIKLNLRKLTKENLNQMLADNSSFAGTSILDGPVINKAAPPTEADPTASVPVGNGTWILLLGIMLFGVHKIKKQ